MTDFTITAVGDATVRQNKPSLNDGSGQWVRVKSGEQRGYLRPQLENIAGRTVLSATLLGHAGPGLVAQTLTVSPAQGRWSPGRVTWSNQPTINGSASVAVPVDAMPDGGPVEWDVKDIIQAVADGTPWYGLRIATNTTEDRQRFYATDSGEPAWELNIVLSDAPEQASDLRPDGGAVDTDTPPLAWAFVDLGGTSTTQAESRVQVDTPAAGAEPDGVAPDFDSGWVANVDPEYDLADSTYTPPVSPPGPTYWRVLPKDGDGNVPIDEDGNELWSDWAEFTVAAKPAWVVDSPTGAFGDPSPRLLAHPTFGSVAWWSAKATGPDRSDVRAESGVQTGAVDWQIPFKNKDGRRVFTAVEGGWIHLTGADTVDRAVAVGHPTTFSVWIPVSLTENPALIKPTGLTVTQLEPGHPQSVWEWDRSESADAWLLEVDGKELARLEADDVTVDAGTYSWVDGGEVTPLRPHTLSVTAIEGTEKSGKATFNRTHVVEGVWLLPEDSDPIMLDGNVVEGFTRSDRVATYVPLVGPEVDIIYDRPLRTGEFVGSVDSRQPDVWAALDAIAELRASRTRRARLVEGSQSMYGRVRSPDATSANDINPANLAHAVRFGFVQTGE